MTDKPALRLLSLGAGVQSTTLLLLADEGRIGPFDAAIFADTGWEPQEVYDHLNRLDAATSIPIHRVTRGNLRDDALNPDMRYASMPLFVKNTDGTTGMGRRQCTHQYKLRPLKTEIRRLLGHPHPTPVPKGVHVEQAIGISADEADRAKESDVGYIRNVFPLLDLHWTRKDCIRYLERTGWATTPKSACIACPFHRNRQWRHIRDTQPAEWADAVAFDQAIRDSRPGVQQYVHASARPLTEARIDRVTRGEWNDRQVDLLDILADEDDDMNITGCSPFACRSDDQPDNGAGDL